MPPVFAHGELRLYLLALLVEGARHGYELMTELADRFGGTYKPSAGTIYPRLARLEEEGLVRRVPAGEAAGRKAPYELTPAGRAEVEARWSDVVRLESSVAETVRSRADELRADIQEAMRGVRAELAAAAAEVRARPRAAPHAAPDQGRATSNALRHEAEAALQQFRREVLADLREADAAGAVSPVTVQTLRTVLDGARAAVAATLPSGPKSTRMTRGRPAPPTDQPPTSTPTDDPATTRSRTNGA
ncbi:PadR family transcriptional regulator [Myceligenerans salitolerans]|uniref:Helix-turn-helix transcriptional regulator n=1 Tax=Myceligenerans salitolerans TaxID=1230528 RepID=A0ABS3I766_9MICO|nr:PadR family transcriptional regulator [Myceligenerans salitolerans]MBO0608845.1 helix-turn-helix transcriptional regulator [Myceligenerans salitolerans]